MLLFSWYDSWCQYMQSILSKLLSFYRVSNSDFIGSDSFQIFFLPVHAENYLRVSGAKIRQKDCSIGSQFWIVFPFSVFCRVVSCWLSVVRRQLWMWMLPSHWSIASSPIGRQQLSCSTACNWSFTSQIPPSGFGPVFATLLKIVFFSVFSKVKYIGLL